MQLSVQCSSFRSVLLFLGICGLLIPPAAAQQSGPLPDTTGAELSSKYKLKSKATARWVSVGAMSATVGPGILLIRNAARRDKGPRAGIYLAGVGLLMAPSAGLVYADAPGRALRGIGIRAGIGLGTAALTAVVGSGVQSSAGPEKGVREAPGPGLGVLAAGVAVGVGGIVSHAVVDAFVNTGRAVEEHNEAIRAERASNKEASVSVGPWVSPHEGRPGLQVHISL